MKLLLLISAVVLAACTPSGAQDKKAKDAKGAPAAVEVTTISVAPREVPVSYEAVGRTEGSREVQVRARVAGILEQILYKEGETVKPGASLFRIERAPFEIELQQARGALAQEKAREELARQELDRIKALVDRRAISQKEADQASSALRQTAGAVQIAEARVRQAELNLSYTTVNAPIGGITGRALQSIGTLVNPASESALLTTLTRADPIWVRFSLSEQEYSRLPREVKRTEVKLEMADGKELAEAARLNFAGSTVDAQTGTVQMRAELPNPKLALLPGQYVKVRVIAGQQQAIVVPQVAVMQNESGRFVWVAAEGKAAPRQIRAGGWLGRDWVVLDGLKAGDAVIVDNLVRLRPGTPVQPKKAG
jgi:membrane fusion protein (multidrug efflux system)